MKLELSYLENGILFCLQGDDCKFPLNQMETAKSSDWLRLNEAEQLWYDGLLNYDSELEGYLLNNNDYFELDDESKNILGISGKHPMLYISETGNLASSQYKINWAPMINEKPYWKKERFGVMVRCAEYEFILSKEQYRLLRAIDNYEDVRDQQVRAKYHSRVTVLANKADVKLDHFTESRGFGFIEEENVGVDVVSPDPFTISIKPTVNLEGREVVVDTSKSTLPSVQFTTDKGKRIKIISSDKAREVYSKVADYPNITGVQVPEFIDNPFRFLPEEFPFNPEDFSDRVKGLKLRKATVKPTVSIEPSENGGWLVSQNIKIYSENGEEAVEEELVITPELQNLMEEAAASGAQYVYYKDQWIKISPQLIQEFLPAVEKVKQEYGDKPVTDVILRYILDIYDNINGIEYNETLVALRSKLVDEYSDSMPPSCFMAKLYPYQQDGYVFLYGHYDTKTGVLLADDMGLGKTIQAIAFLAKLYSVEKLKPALIVLPKTLIENWVKELNKFLPSSHAKYNVYVHQGPQRYKNHKIIEQYDIVLTTYESLTRDQTILGKIDWSCIICDEVQKIKNYQTASANALKAMKTSCRIAMTGTPVENRLSELWSIVDFAQPGLLGSYQSFRKTYELPIEKHEPNREELIDSLVNVISPIFLRRTKDDVLAGQLPAKHEETVYLNMDIGTKKLYQDILDKTIGTGQKGMALAAIQNLLMLCSHPQLYVHGYAMVDDLIKQSPKMQWTVDQLAKIFAKNEKVLIFTKYKDMQAILRRVIWEKFGINANIINGEVTGNRQAVVDNFNASVGAGALILSPRAAGVGLTITSANHVIHYTREWNPAVENQATDRAYRIGQKNDVFVYYPVVTDPSFVTIEDRLADLLQQKRELMKNVIIPMDLEIKIDDFKDVFEGSLV